MKIEDAIKYVKEVTGMSLHWDDKHYEALQMAIKALEDSKWIPMSEQYKNKQSNCKKMPLPEPYREVEHDNQ